MPTNIVNREKAEALISAQVQKEIIQGPITSSVIMSKATKLPNMTSNQTRIKVLDALPMAYWVNGDTGRKSLTSQAWDNVFVNAAELAVIVPIPDSVLADAEIDIMGEIIPRVNEAFGQKVDAACIFDEDRPEGWGPGIVTRARIAGNNIVQASGKDLYDLLLGEGGVYAAVEDSGNSVNAVLASTRFKSKLRGLRNTSGTPIFSSDMHNANSYALDGVPMTFPDNGSFDTSIAALIAGDFSKLVYSIRNGVETKILTEAVIQDPATGAIVYNLAQQDMTAIRVTFRLGFAVPNYATRLDPSRIGCPFAYLEPSTPVTAQTVTFTVKDSSAAVVEGARVSIDGAFVSTNESGVATAKLVAGTYPITVTKDGFKKTTDSVTVAAEAVAKDITLTAK